MGPALGLDPCALAFPHFSLVLDGGDELDGHYSWRSAGGLSSEAAFAARVFFGFYLVGRRLSGAGLLDLCDIQLFPCPGDRFWLGGRLADLCSPLGPSRVGLESKRHEGEKAAEETAKKAHARSGRLGRRGGRFPSGNPRDHLAAGLAQRGHHAIAGRYCTGFCHNRQAKINATIKNKMLPFCDNVMPNATGSVSFRSISFKNR